MIALFVIAAASAALTVGSAAAGVTTKSSGPSAHTNTAEARPVDGAAPAFDAGSYASASDCLNAASRLHVELNICRSGPSN